MLHAFVRRFDVTDTVQIFLGTKRGLSRESSELSKTPTKFSNVAETTQMESVM